MFKFPWTKQQEIIDKLIAELATERTVIFKLMDEIEKLKDANEMLHMRNTVQALAAKRYQAIRAGYEEQPGDVFAMINTIRGECLIRGDKLDVVVDAMIHNYEL